MSAPDPEKGTKTLATFFDEYKTKTEQGTFGQNLELMKKIKRDYALDALQSKNGLECESMLLYNMATHACETDPCGFFYAMDMIHGPSPKVRVDLAAFGRMLGDVAVSMSAQK